MIIPTSSLKILLEKETRGDALDDHQLRYLLSFFKEMEEGLAILGKDFGLATNEVRRRKLRLEEIDFWRKNL